MRFNWSYPLPTTGGIFVLPILRTGLRKIRSGSTICRGEEMSQFSSCHSTLWFQYLQYYYSWARDNTAATNCFLGHKIVGYCIMLQLLHLDTETLTFFIFVSGNRSFITLSRCDCREAKQLSRAQLCLWPILSQKELHITATAKC